MSTRASLIYRDEPSLHIYQELLDNTVHVEVDRAGVLVDVVIMSYDEWVSLGLPKECVRLQSAAEQSVQRTCAKCGGKGEVMYLGEKVGCDACQGTGTSR